MKSCSRALGQRFTGFAADNFHSVASPGVFERIVFRYGLAVLYVALLALLMSWFSSSRRRAEQSLSQARRELETKVEERTAKLSLANEELQTEIGERKSAEEKLQRSKAFLSEGQRISHTGSWSW